MKILKLPRFYGIREVGQSYLAKCTLGNEILPTARGWLFVLWKKSAPTAVFATCPSVYLLRNDNHQIEKFHNDGSVINLSGGVALLDTGGFNNGSPSYPITPEGQIDDDAGGYGYIVKDFENKEYSCFIHNPPENGSDNSNDMFIYMNALLALAGITNKESVLIIYNKLTDKSIAFTSPLKKPLVGVSPSMDGLTFLMLSEDQAAVIDNPMM